MSELHPAVARVTERVDERSKDTRGRYLGIRGPAEKEGPVRACEAALPRWSGWLYAQ